MAENLNKIWARAIPLQDVFRTIRDGIEFKLPDYLILSNKQQAELSNLTRSLQHLALSLEHITSTQEKDRQARTQLKNSLVAGELLLIGRCIPGDGPARYEWIDPSFWIGAKCDPYEGSASLNELHYDELRAASPGAFGTDLPSRSNLVENEDAGARTQGRPSHESTILEAIKHHAGTTQGWWSTARSDRRAAYYEYIRSRHGIDPQKASGFGVKTIEKYETKYRKESDF